MHWASRFLLLLPIGILLATVGVGILIDTNESISPFRNRLLTGLFLISTAILFLYPVIDYVRAKVTWRRNKESLWDEIRGVIREESRRHSKAAANPSWEQRKGSFFLLFVAAYIVMPIALSDGNVYRISDEIVYLVWFVLFPIIVLVDWASFRKRQYKKHREKIRLIRVSIEAMLLSMLFVYVEVGMSFVNRETRSFIVDIRSVSSSGGGRGVSCGRRATIVDSLGYLRSFCLANVRQNLVDGNVSYVDNGKAVIVLRSSWLGDVVESIEWKPVYTSKDRTWSVEQ